MMTEFKLIGKKIVEIRKLTRTEYNLEGWDTFTTALVLDDGTIIYPSQDDEGNGPGTLFGKKGNETFYIFASDEDIKVTK